LIQATPDGADGAGEKNIRKRAVRNIGAVFFIKDGIVIV